MDAPGAGVLKTRKGEIVNARCLETSVEIEGNGSDDSLKSLELGCRKVQDRANHAMHTRSLVHYESMKRNLKIKPLYECRCSGRLQTKRFTRLTHTGLVVELEHLKIMTRSTNEKFASVKGECEI